MHPHHFLAFLSQSLLWAPSSSFLQPHPSSGRRSIGGCQSISDGRCPREGRCRRPSAPSCREDNGRHRTSERGDEHWGAGRRRPTHLCLSSRPRSTDDDDSREGNTQKRTRRRTPSTAADAKVITNGPTNGRTNPSNASPTTFSTALAIVPPDHAWDALQRARHLARDTTFYRWPPAIRLFHPFAPKSKVPELVGKLAEFIDDEMGKLELVEILDEGMEWMGEDVGYYDKLEGMLAEMMERGVVKSKVVEGALDVLDRRLDGGDCEDGDDVDDSGDGDGRSSERINGDTSNINNDPLSPAEYLQSFEVTLDSIQILPHYEVLDARLEALEERRPQRTLGESVEERERRRRIEEGRALIEEEERRGRERKRERERKRRLKREMKEREGMDDDAEEWSEGAAKNVDNASDGNDDGNDDEDEGRPTSPATTKNEYNGPCIIYLAPDDASKSRLDALRARLKDELFGDYDAFSPGSSVSPYPECLPRNTHRMAAGSAAAASTFRPLLPIGRFPNVESAVKVARVLQRTWDPLTFNVTDIQFVSRDEGGDVPAASGAGLGTHNLASTNHRSGHTDGADGGGLDMDIPEVRHRRKHGTLLDATDAAKDRMALTSSGEVDDVGRRGAYGCDAAVMLWGEELEEDVMEAEASLSMIVDDDDDDEDECEGDDANDAEEFDVEDGEEYLEEEDGGSIDYSRVFATAEREYQRMRAHEELSAANGEGPVVDDADATTTLEAWLDGDDDEAMEDEGATVVVGRAQLFLGAHRDFVGMPASSAIDSKDRIMGGGVSATARRKGSVSRMTESWDAGDYGQKETDRRP